MTYVVLPTPFSFLPTQNYTDVKIWGLTTQLAFTVLFIFTDAYQIFTEEKLIFTDEKLYFTDI
jgi:hypothetical protein